MREHVSPKVIEQISWAGANTGSYRAACEALQRLAGVEVTIKQVQRITSSIGGDACEQRRQAVEAHASKPLMERVRPRCDIPAPELGVVMMDGGRLQRRDCFGQRSPAGGAVTHWREDKVGLCLSMRSQTHDHDPCAAFPSWLAGAEVVAEIARLGQPETLDTGEETDLAGDTLPDREAAWPDAPKLISREVIASCQGGEEFGRHLAWQAWHSGVSAAKRQAFVADGARVNWTIHQTHFCRMTPVLDLMHALSYAYRAAEELASRGSPVDHQTHYSHWAAAIWQGRVADVIAELAQLTDPLADPATTSAEDGAPTKPVAEPNALQRALTYYRNHRERMNYPQYRREGLPLTSSLMESAIKQINLRVKGTEKFWRSTAAEAVLQLRADTLSDSQPLAHFWSHWHAQQNGSNRYQTTAA